MLSIRSSRRLLWVCLAVAIVWPSVALAAAELPRLRADGSRTSVSGLSSGAFAAVQYAVAFSSSVKGVGVVAGGPYNCANVQLGNVQYCMTGQPSGAAAFQSARLLELAGQIDPVSSIAKQRVYIFTGSKDNVVLPSVVAATADFYRAAGVPPGNLSYVIKVPAGHAFVSPGADNACGSNESPFVEHCDYRGHSYDQAAEILSQVYGPMKPPSLALSSNPRPFDQRSFGSAATGLGPIGFVYIPSSCATDAKGCAVHVVFHGCEQGYPSVGSDVFSGAGFNRWADTNHLIVLYPQIQASAAFPFNPQGCWDWWGQLPIGVYTGPTFMTRSGVQMSAVKAMVDRLTGH